MARERAYEAIAPVAFTANGQNSGIITVDSTFCFKVKMIVVLNADGFEPARYQVKRVLNSTKMVLGAEKTSLHNRSDITAYVLGVNPTVKAHEQDRPDIPPVDYERAVYEEEPTVAKRVFNVDKFGKPYTTANPFPVEAEVTINNPNRHRFKAVTIATKNTEVFFTFPDNTKYYQIKARKDKDVIRVGLNAGDIAAGDYWEIPFGGYFSLEQIMNFASGYTLYFESKHKDSVELEIFYYIKV